VPASTPAAVSLIAAISDALESGQNVAVHCRQGFGSGRSGLIAAGVLASTGIDPDRAIEIVSSARGQTVPETPGQRSWVLRLPSDRMSKPRRKTDGKMPEAIQRPDLGTVEPSYILGSKLALYLPRRSFKNRPSAGSQVIKCAHASMIT
jgi:hypothetical protein